MKSYKVVNGTYYDKNTPDEVIRVLENARKSGQRVRVFYGNTITGQDWGEDCDTMGYVDRSYGEVRVPILVKTKRSGYGAPLLANHIVKITINKRTFYCHPNYRYPVLESEWEKKNEMFFTGMMNVTRA